MFYEETMEQGSVCGKERVGGWDSSMVKLFPEQPGTEQHTHTVTLQPHTTHTYTLMKPRARINGLQRTGQDTEVSVNVGGRVCVHVSLFMSRCVYV